MPNAYITAFARRNLTNTVGPYAYNVQCVQQVLAHVDNSRVSMIHHFVLLLIYIYFFFWWPVGLIIGRNLTVFRRIRIKRDYIFSHIIVEKKKLLVQHSNTFDEIARRKYSTLRPANIAALAKTRLYSVSSADKRSKILIKTNNRKSKLPI